MQSPIIIGLSGYKQSGKDTVSNFLRAHFPTLPFHKVAFADSLKDEVCEFLKINREELEKDKEKYRGILQTWGQDAKQARGELVWVHEVSKKIQLYQLIKTTAPKLIVISDCRFPFEAKWIKELGGMLVKVERFDSTDDPHPSEQEVGKIRGFDYFLPNKGTLRDLERECKWLSAAIKERYKL